MEILLKLNQENYPSDVWEGLVSLAKYQKLAPFLNELLEEAFIDSPEEEVLSTQSKDILKELEKLTGMVKGLEDKLSSPNLSFDRVSMGDVSPVVQSKQEEKPLAEVIKFEGSVSINKSGGRDMARMQKLKKMKGV